jgi:hypothetical protein
VENQNAKRHKFTEKSILQDVSEDEK